VVVTLVTDRVERLEPGSVLHGPDGPLEVVSAKPFKHRWIVDFAGVASREAADALHGATLSAEPVDDPDALWVHELIGAEVATPDGRTWGGWRRSWTRPRATCSSSTTGRWCRWSS
jgi:16S rRNA processing protein RimM